MIKKAKLISILSGICVFSLSMGLRTNIEVKAEAEPRFWEGFAITATAVRTAAPTGLRFKTDVERLTPLMQKYNPNAEYYTTLTFICADGQEFETACEVDVWRPDGSGWNTVLLEIPESDYTTQITAQSFIKFNASEFYKTEPVTISIAQTAAAAMSYGADSNYLEEYFDDIVTGVTLNQTSASLQEGKTLQLTATTMPSGYKAKFSTSDASVATVDANGKVQAKGVGTALITAEINGYQATCEVSVTKGSETVSAFTSSLKPSGISDKTVDIATWLNNVFADERVGAVTFDVHSTKADTALMTEPSMISVSFSANQTISLSITRAMYEKWQASGTNTVKFTAKHNGGWMSSSTISFTNFQLVFMQEFEESQALTASEVEALNGYIPDYSNNSYQFDFLGYSALGSYSAYNAEQEAGKEDYRNIYRIEEYKESGMTILYLQSEACIPEGDGNNFNFATSKMKQVMDMALEAGMTKVVACDYRIAGLSNDTESLIGEGKKFATQADLDAQIKKWMEPYVTHGAFYGVQLADEPGYTQFTAYGQVYRTIKRLYPNAYVHSNLFPCTEDAVSNGIMAAPSENLVTKYINLGYGSNAETLAAWEGYLTAFLEATGAGYIMYDRYPLKANGTIELYLAVMQVAANVAKEHGVAFKFVSQTFSFDSADKRILTEEDLRWLNNMALGFGINQLSYYTYFTCGEFLDGASFITSNGEKTDIYYAMREIMTENQEFASTILSFAYQASATYTAHTAYNNNLAGYCIDNTFAKLQSVVVNQENALISELYDKNYNRHMYMVQNLADPFGGAVKATQMVKLAFNENYEYAIVWKNGKQSVVKLENNEYVVNLDAGEAVYVIPFNPAENSDERFVFDAAKGDNGVWFPTIS